VQRRDEKLVVHRAADLRVVKGVVEPRIRAIVERQDPVPALEPIAATHPHVGEAIPIVVEPYHAVDAVLGQIAVAVDDAGRMATA
jgi:hypothetical protein